MANTRTWPCFYAGREIVGPRVQLPAGAPFPVQEKNYIRGLGKAAGYDGNAWTVRFSDLDYVDQVDAGSEEMARHVLEQALTVEEARHLVGAD